MSNRDTYQSEDVIAYYSGMSSLFPPEAAILGLLQNRLHGMKMLDIGVGAGRTTPFFAPFVREYVGIDYSEEMIAACKKKFSGSGSHVSFDVMDVREMSGFKGSLFDFVLFSYNGIDYIGHEDRLKAFREIRKVMKRGGTFCFSTHNIQNVETVFHLKHHLSLNPVAALKGALKWALLRTAYNRHLSLRELKNAPYAVVNDSAHRFRLETYYISPAEQARQLEGLFENISLWGLSDGRKIEEKERWDLVKDDWLTFLCAAK